MVVGVLAKIVGCGSAAKCFKYNARDSLTIGCGMIARGEVALAVYAAGQSLIWYDKSGTLAGIDPLVATIFLIICSSILCPILLKAVLKNHNHPEVTDKKHRVSISAEAIENTFPEKNS